VLLHGHTHPSGAGDQASRLRGTLVRNVTGWHLVEIAPGSGLTDPVGEPPRGPHAGSRES